MRRIIHSLALFWFWLYPAALAGAQSFTHLTLAQRSAGAVPVFNATGIGDQLKLDEGWRFQPGDNPAWSSPELDDRSWLSVDLNRPLPAYGFKNIPYGWLRLHVQLPPDARNLVFATNRTLGRYQLFANGVLIGSLGDLNRHDLYDVAVPRMYPLPASAYNERGDLVLALRVSLQKISYVGVGPEAPFLLGSAFLGTARSITDAGTAALLLQIAPISVDAIPALITAAVALALFLSLRTHREYLYLAIYAFLVSCLSVELLESWLRPYHWPFLMADWLLEAAVAVAFSEFIRETLRLPRSRLLTVAELLPLAVGSHSLLWLLGHISFVMAEVPYNSALALSYTVLLVLLFRSALAGNLDARILLPGTLPFIAFNIADAVRSFSGAEQLTLHIGSFVVKTDTLADIVLELTLLLFITTRSIRIARERNRVASEVEAAQTVQKLLLSRSEVNAPAFRIKRVYRPASEVGGDFFLLLPDTEDDSLVAIIGDVSGKGLTAAMYVSMILGALRRENVRSPGQILSNLNDALVAQSVTGFTTACCVHLQSTGEYLVANAGHISPYVAGIEIQTSAALPLGLAPDQAYAEIHGRLLTTQTMVLLSDGVPEARTSTGELYGFERLASLTLEPADTIADTAQNFGQEDDITVLSLALRV